MSGWTKWAPIPFRIGGVEMMLESRTRVRKDGSTEIQLRGVPDSVMHEIGGTNVLPRPMEMIEDSTDET